ncbi:ribosomal protein S18-alanine N-acetyltransferase [Clostridium aminobutyricum]|uniref:[Ribosomal protein bS18]-alanine N-acetyltransferase n=1 Tax=Clostridium aminobutyricum TaxID=33953 RepID=A0A939IK59_CLOAM|nr:ribosomal protein S18-alanine N-acetyltransferase [Clostridium aminobutyricum]MBN7774298.1 ribosomal protein S18-alanine N-acetyltransferase [Clostridium aminobutyricum]
MSSLIIRKAEVTDIEEMAALDLVCFTAPWSEEAFRQELEENNLAFYVVAELNEQIVGYAGLWAILEEGHITNVAVAPEYRRKGIGNAVVEVLLDASEQAGLNSFTLEVRISNIQAQNLYKKFDFTEAGIRKGYYQDNGEDAIIMWRRKSNASCE